MNRLKQHRAGLFGLLAVMTIAAIAACATNPLSTANKATDENKPETIAFALHNSYVVVAEKALNVAQQQGTPVAVKENLVKLHEAASPIAKQLQSGARKIQRIRAALAAGETPEEKLAVALEELNALLTPENVQKLNAVAEAVGGGL